MLWTLSFYFDICLTKSGQEPTYLRLDTTEEQAFQTELDKLGVAQREEIMETLTSWEERGLEKGIEQGREQERRAIALNMLRKSLPLETISEITGLTLDQLQQLQATAEQTES
ncbi:MAG: hypothetical protein MUC48_09290 [Leptolyngbya sp. Prado105]|jgi:predicted transposase/invertase (TIGR01784 family)|nr:hypothetical protein [Leptolyngbya sp. Prado105]